MKREAHVRLLRLWHDHLQKPFRALQLIGPRVGADVVSGGSFRESS